METKKKKNIFLHILTLLFFIYVVLYIAFQSGYYQTKAYNRAVLTKDAMEQFEADLQNGEVVDVKDYLKEERVDYSNGVTKLGNKLSNSVSEVMTKGISGLFSALKDLFW